MAAEENNFAKNKRDCQRRNYGHFIDNLLPLFISFFAITLMPEDENQGAGSAVCLRLKLSKSNLCDFLHYQSSLKSPQCVSNRAFHKMYIVYTFIFKELDIKNDHAY